MELTIAPNSDIHVKGPVTVEVPAYMKLLPTKELELVRVDPDRARIVVAAGRHPNGDIVFITGVGDLREINVETQSSECIDFYALVAPENHGRTIKCYATMRSCEIGVGWALEHSRSLLFFGHETQKLSEQDT